MEGRLYCISGPSSTGKSTLLDALKNRLPHVYFISEWARRLFNQQYKEKYGTMDAMLQIPAAAYEYQMELARLTVGNRVPGKVVVIDRAPLDVLVYTLMNAGQLGAGVTKVMDIVLESAKDVDAVFITKDNNSYEDDGFRPEAYKQARRLEIELFDHFARICTNKLVYLPASTEERVETVMEFMEHDGALIGRQQLALL